MIPQPPVVLFKSPAEGCVHSSGVVIIICLLCIVHDLPSLRIRLRIVRFLPLSFIGRLCALKLRSIGLFYSIWLWYSQL